MRNTGHRFVPGIRIEVKEEEPEEEIIFQNFKASNAGNGTSNGNAILDKLVAIEVTTEEVPSNDTNVTPVDVHNDVNDDDDDVEESFIVPSGIVK